MDELVDKLNEKTRSSLPINNLDCRTGFVELGNKKFAIKSYLARVNDLRSLKREAIYFVDKTIKELSEYDEVFIRKEWEIICTNPSLCCPYTFDQMEKPSEGYWTIYGRFRGVDKKEYVDYT